MRALWLLPALGALLWSGPLLSPREVAAHLGEENPRIAQARSEVEAAVARVRGARGAYDVTALLRVDEKRYPLGDGEFFDATLSKHLGSGLSIFGGYRRATGVQEYNNIKTGGKGEYRAGVNLSLVSLLLGVDRQGFAL
ncbi:hypothetical protein [Hydrogenimonas sp.]